MCLCVCSHRSRFLLYPFALWLAYIDNKWGTCLSPTWSFLCYRQCSFPETKATSAGNISYWLVSENVFVCHLLTLDAELWFSWVKIIKCAVPTYKKITFKFLSTGMVNRLLLMSSRDHAASSAREMLSEAVLGYGREHWSGYWGQYTGEVVHTGRSLADERSISLRR
jgi:hypothetical protein